MNIGIVLDNDLDGDHRVIREVNILKKAGHSIHILCFSHQSEPHSEIEGVHVERIKMSKKLKNILFFFVNRIPLYEWVWQRAIHKFIMDNQIDLIHAHDLYMSKPAHRGIQSSKRDIKLILDLHENYPATILTYNWTKGILRGFISNPKAWLKKEGEYLSYASCIIVLSEPYKQKLIGKFEFLKDIPIVAFPNVIDFNLFASFKVDPNLKKSDSITLMYFGVVAERRGVFDAIDILSRGRKNGLNISLLLIGPVDKADKSRLDALIYNPELQDHIKHIPWIHLSELVSYMNISDILLSPILKNDQHESGVANKIFQYMFGRKPIIVSDCGPQRKLIEDFECGLVYENQDAFYRCVENLSNDKSIRDEMGENGYKALHAYFDTDQYESTLVNLYNSIVP